MWLLLLPCSEGFGFARIRVPKNGYPKGSQKWRHELPSNTFRSAARVATLGFILGTRFWNPFRVQKWSHLRFRAPSGFLAEMKHILRHRALIVEPLSRVAIRSIAAFLTAATTHIRWRLGARTRLLRNPARRLLALEYRARCAITPSLQGPSANVIGSRDLGRRRCCQVSLVWLASSARRGHMFLTVSASTVQVVLSAYRRFSCL